MMNGKMILKSAIGINWFKVIEFEVIDRLIGIPTPRSYLRSQSEAVQGRLTVLGTSLTNVKTSIGLNEC